MKFKCFHTENTEFRKFIVDILPVVHFLKSPVVMGLTIHYSGKLRGPECIQPLIEEAIDIASHLKWEFQELPDHPDVPVTGVLISPEGSEPLWLTFMPDGTMCNPLLYEYVLEHEGTGIPSDRVEKLLTEKLGMKKVQ
ncbi:MAG TPA: hypothetical protein VJ508_18245 [Saprospiraceae bacterium]|nr:hypothetical protein [Saprospiraceae bacterium]